MKRPRIKSEKIKRHLRRVHRFRHNPRFSQTAFVLAAIGLALAVFFIYQSFSG